ncbi:MAG: hypothetical protein ACLUG4_01450 [Bacilli bacterium]
MDQKEFNWNHFLQPYELAVEGFILKIEGIKKQYQLRRSYCPIEIVTGRVKSPDSILDKARRMDVEFENISKKYMILVESGLHVNTLKMFIKLQIF